MDVDAVYERAADLFLISSDGHGRTTALFDGVTVIPARAGVWVDVAIYPLLVR